MWSPRRDERRRQAGRHPGPCLDEVTCDRSCAASQEGQRAPAEEPPPTADDVEDDAGLFLEPGPEERPTLRRPCWLLGRSLRSGAASVVRGRPPVLRRPRVAPAMLLCGREPRVGGGTLGATRSRMLSATTGCCLPAGSLLGRLQGLIGDARSRSVNARNCALTLARAVDPAEEPADQCYISIPWCPDSAASASALVRWTVSGGCSGGA